MAGDGSVSPGRGAPPAVTEVSGIVPAGDKVTLGDGAEEGVPHAVKIKATTRIKTNAI